MAKITGVGKERIISSKKYFPIYFRFNGHRYNSSVKAESKFDAYRQLQAWMAEIMTKPRIITNGETNYDVIREVLRKDVNSDITARKTRNLYINVFNRVFVDFRQRYYPALLGCSSLPMGFFRKYKSYTCEELKRNWRAEIIYVKAIMNRLTKLGYSTEDDLKQVRSIATPEGSPRPMPKHTDKQVLNLLEYARKDRPDFYKPIKFMHLVGRRADETCSILKEDVSMNGLDPLVIQTRPETTKMKKQLPPPIYLEDPELKALIKSTLANNKTPWLFPHKNGGKIHPNYLWKYLSKASIQAIGVKVTPHFFRKKFLTESNRGGLNKDSMAMANIKNVSVMMKHYVETTPEGQAKLLEKNRNRAYNGNS